MVDERTPKAKQIKKLVEFISSDRNLVLDKSGIASAEKAIAARMTGLKLIDVDAYLDYLQAHPGEYDSLIDLLLPQKSLLIDEPVWGKLKDLLGSRSHERERPYLRAWIVGTSTGEEAYGLAIGLAEEYGQSLVINRCRIFATGLYEDDLAVARHGSFSAVDLKSACTDEMLGRYFTSKNDRLIFRTDLRRAIIFGRHDVTRDPPISKIDLIICRRVFPFLNQETQRKTARNLLNALNSNGYLVLGDWERLPYDPELRSMGTTENIIHKNQYFEKAIRPPEVVDGAEKRVKLIETACDITSPATICVSADGTVAAINSQARELFNLVPQDIGRPLQDLEVSYRPIELRSLIERASSERNEIVINRVTHSGPPMTILILEIHVTPILEGEIQIGVQIQFHDVTAMHALQEELSILNHQLQTANEELQSSHEELETTNEELQSTNEEMETTNEELQSTNEALETMNEELQCTNTELEFSNNGQRILVQSVDRLHAFLEAVLSSMQSAVFVVDSNHKILAWNQYCTELWGMRQDEVISKDFFNLDIGFPVNKLKKPFEGLFKKTDGMESLQIDAINRRGNRILCSVKITRLIGSDGLIVLIDDDKKPRDGAPIRD